MNGDQWPDHVRLTEIEDRFICTACGKRGATIRGDTNKAGQPAAELVEPRAGAEGNVSSAKHGPGTVPGNRVTAAEAHTAFRENITTRRYTPEVGAVCPNWARTDLCGGREVTRVPTANVYWLSAQREILTTSLNSTETAASPSMQSISATTNPVKKPKVARSGKGKSRAA